MLKIILFILFSVISINSQYINYIVPCDCGDKKTFDPISWECVNNPTRVSQGWIKNCVSYYIKQGRFICNQCESEYYLDNRYDSRQKCVKSKIEHCKIVEKQFPRPKCLECEQGYYSDYRQLVCTKLQEPNDIYYIENCIHYTRDLMQCAGCKQGYYVSLDKFQCIKNPNNICLRYEFLRTGIRCKECIPKYFIDKDYACKKVSTFIPNCYQAEYISYEEQQFQCQECNEGFYASYNKGKCIKNPKKGQQGHIKHCQIYEIDSQNNLTCYQCKSEDYSLTEDGYYCNILKKSSIVNNCEIYQDMDGFQGCIQCLNGYQHANTFWPYNSCRKCPNY